MLFLVVLLESEAANPFVATFIQILDDKGPTVCWCQEAPLFVFWKKKPYERSNNECQEMKKKKGKTNPVLPKTRNYMIMCIVSKSVCGRLLEWSTLWITDFVVAVRSEEKRRLSREEVFVLKKKSCFEIWFLSAISIFCRRGRKNLLSKSSWT